MRGKRGEETAALTGYTVDWAHGENLDCNLRDRIHTVQHKVHIHCIHLHCSSGWFYCKARSRGGYLLWTSPRLQTCWGLILSPVCYEDLWRFFNGACVGRTCLFYENKPSSIREATESAAFAHTLPYLLCGRDQPARRGAGCPHCSEGEAGGGRYLAPGEVSCLRAPSVVSVSHLKVGTERVECSQFQRMTGQEGWLCCTTIWEYE